MWRPQGDSNPCYRRERAMSWASRRWGRESASPLASLGGAEDYTPRGRGTTPGGSRGAREGALTAGEIARGEGAARTRPPSELVDSSGVVERPREIVSAGV